eukprot:CAMPEP_0181193182 /NCGR_PEP_ID=MMETSP1096-20121128/13682_1 /TAXON_ID=156174 ORGANISM="Chrysochromulina ericina, Strain CCMP281" /NCGR_SAMPLE_ID=MMETSP1096 /ASSEMBLY_ACC=CAM_ASM_000453 /LENGTH=120 /DNA_ID=CAMNT_0023282631 /DNA_START=124 /DNA_END=486 /DNA_ORIENTATION=-
MEVLCKGGCECLCCVAEDCCVAGEPSKGIGCAKKEDLICGLACPCCMRGLKVPTVLVSGGASCLCCYDACSFPFSEDYVPGPVCAVCCLQCAPEMGCCKPPPPSKALGKGGPVASEEMQR